MFDVVKRAPRELIAFAFVQEEFARSGDIARGLMPLFAPLLATKTFRHFDPTEFAKTVESTYDIPMSPLVAEGLIPQLAAAGLLEETEPHVYRVSKFDYPHPAPDESSVIEGLLDEFAKISEASLKRAELDIPIEELKGGFLKRLTDLDFLSFLGRPDKNYFKGRKLALRKDIENDEPPNPEQALDVLCAAFAVHISEAFPEKFELLSRISKGALIAEVVLTLQTPSVDSDLSAVTVVFDGPLILDFLDLSTPELKDHATALFDLIDRARLKKAVLLHTLEEMQGTIRAPLDALMRGEQPYGPLGNRIRRSANDAAYARAMLNDLPNALGRLGIEIIDAKEYETPEFKQYCPEEIEDSLRNDFGLHQDTFERRQRDAHSIATLMRMRTVVLNPQSLLDASSVLVTRNSAVAIRSRKTLVYRKRLRDTDFPPVLTDRQIAGLLWFAVGGNLGALSRTKLIANCSAALQPRTDIASKLSQVLYEKDPSKVEVFAALMRDQRAQRSLMHETLGFPTAITRDNAEVLLEQMRLATAEQVRREAASREEQLRTTLTEQIQTLMATHNAERQRLQTEIMQLSSANAQLSSDGDKTARQQQAQLDQLAATLSEVKSQREEDTNRRVQSAIAFANAARRRLRALVVVLYASLVLTAALALNNTWFGLGLGTVMGVLGFWFVPNLIFDKALDVAWHHHFRVYAKRSDVEASLHHFQIDASNGTATRR